MMMMPLLSSGPSPVSSPDRMSVTRIRSDLVATVLRFAECSRSSLRRGPFARLFNSEQADAYPKGKIVFSQGQPSDAVMYIAYMLARNIRIEADLVDHLFNSSEKWLARTLLLARYGDQGGRQRRIPNISQESL